MKTASKATTQPEDCLVSRFGGNMLRLVYICGETAAAVQDFRGMLQDATYQSPVGSPAHQLKWLRESGRFESEIKAAQVALERADAEFQRAKSNYNLVLTETPDTPACV
ncbi:MAG: hypothetical protein IH974_07420 [Myxococcales bacterium]|nr:hypothetical protein [Myxococcales bacterium]